MLPSSIRKMERKRCQSNNSNTSASAAIYPACGLPILNSTFSPIKIEGQDESHD